MQGDMSATRLRRAGPANLNLKIPLPRADSELHFIQVSTFKLLCHSASRWPRLQRPPCLAKCHDTLQHFPGPAGEKNAGQPG